MHIDRIRIDRLTTPEEFHVCEELQRRVWGMADIDVLPLHMMITFQRSGGLVLGAFDERDEMVGFLLGFLGAQDGGPGRLKHCSHMMGVDAAWRGRGVGRRLKLAQRDAALAQGLDLVTWTFDPLESRNAALNIGRLGGVCRTFISDLYGPMDDALNAGLSTDRFQVDWWIASDHVAHRLEGVAPSPSLDDLMAAAPPVNPAVVDDDGLVRPPDCPRALDGERILIEIPADVRTIKASDFAAARRWREQTSDLFQRAFAAGYTAVDFISERSGAAPARRSVYVLQRDFEVI